MSYVYIRGADCYTVGHYNPANRWIPESDHENAEAAAERCAFLNGGAELRAARALERIAGELERLNTNVNGLRETLTLSPPLGG